MTKFRHACASGPSLPEALPNRDTQSCRGDQYIKFHYRRDLNLKLKYAKTANNTTVIATVFEPMTDVSCSTTDVNGEKMGIVKWYGVAAFFVLAGPVERVTR